jgi:hypothetical protein
MLQVGDKVEYTKHIMFKGDVKLVSKVVAITDINILLESGDTFHKIQIKK